MTLKRSASTIFGVIAIVALAIIDRFLKMTAEGSSFDSYRLGWRYLAFERFHNPGIAFGLPIPLWLVLPLTLFFLISLFIWVHKSKNPLAHVALLAIFLGALSNAYDRVTYGYTIDFLRIFDSIINIADLMILVGIACLLFIKRSNLEPV